MKGVTQLKVRGSQDLYIDVTTISCYVANILFEIEKTFEYPRGCEHFYFFQVTALL